MSGSPAQVDGEFRSGADVAPPRKGGASDPASGDDSGAIDRRPAEARAATAAPVSQVSVSATDDVRAEIESLRLRLDEQGALLRRTHQAVASLADSLGKVVAQQRRRERGLNLNSFIAYMLFTVLLGGGFFMLYSVRAGDLLSARDAAVRAREDARARLQALEAEHSERERASTQALSYYQLLREGRHAEAVARYPEIERQRLTATEAAVFASGVDEARGSLVDAGYLAGLDAFRGGDLDTAVTEFKTAIAYEDSGPRVAQMRYYLGVALSKQGDHEAAVRNLELAIAGGVEQQDAVDVRYQLAVALEGLGEFDKARAEYDRFASAYPRLPLSWTARRSATRLARKAVRTN